MREHRDGLRLIAEAAAEVGVLGKVALEHLDSHESVQAVALGLVDNGHAAAADDFEQFIAVVEHFSDHIVHTDATSFTRVR